MIVVVSTFFAHGEDGKGAQLLVLTLVIDI